MRHIATLLAAVGLVEVFCLGAHFGDPWERYFLVGLAWRLCLVATTLSAAYIAWHCHRRWEIVVRQPFYAAQPQTQQPTTRASAPPAGQVGTFQQTASRN
jgi:hypothetical protein